MSELSHRERIDMILAGQKPDRFAASFWRHFFHRESTAEGLADAMVGFQKQFDWDFMKINPRADYHIEDWGFRQAYSTDEFTKHKKVAFPVATVDDWTKIQPLPMTSPALAEQLKAISLIRKQVGKDLPILMTVFTPLAIAGRMVPDGTILVDHLRNYPDKMHAPLTAIAQTFRVFVTECRNAGADGVFFATTSWASEDRLTWQEYEEFGLRYDLEVISASHPDSLNLFHVCASNNYLGRLADHDYRSKLVNWDESDPTNLTLDKGLTVLSNKVVVGGVDHRGWLINSDAGEMNYLIDNLKSKYNPAKLIIGPGCAIDPATPAANLKAIRDRL
jgi:uroporphyrinogen decarboxylase